MKYEIYVPKAEVEAEKPEPVTYLALKKTSTHSAVILHAVFENGEHVPGSNIVKITSKGLYLFRGVTDEIGLPLDGNKVKVDTSF